METISRNTEELDVDKQKKESKHRVLLGKVLFDYIVNLLKSDIC